MRLCDKMEVLIAASAKNSMPYMVLPYMLNLPNLNKLEMQLENEVLLSHKLHDDPLDILHMRGGHVSKSKLIEGFRDMLFTGSGYSRSHLSKSSSTLQRIDISLQGLCESSVHFPPSPLRSCKKVLRF